MGGQSWSILWFILSNKLMPLKTIQSVNPLPDNPEQGIPMLSVGLQFWQEGQRQATPAYLWFQWAQEAVIFLGQWYGSSRCCASIFSGKYRCYFPTESNHSLVRTPQIKKGNLIWNCYLLCPVQCTKAVLGNTWPWVGTILLWEAPGKINSHLGTWLCQQHTKSNFPSPLIVFLKQWRSFGLLAHT